MTSGGRYLRVVLEGDALAHFELGHGDPPRGAISTSPMVARARSAVHAARVHGNVVESAELKIEIDAATLCAMVTDTARGFILQRACPADAGLTI